MRLRNRQRRGVTLLETAVAIAVLAAAMVILVQTVTAAARQRRASDQRRLALQEVANQAERIALLSWEETGPDTLKTWQPSPELKDAISAAQCQISVSEDEGPPASRRLRLFVIWTGTAGQQLEPVELTVWKYRR